MIWNNCQEKKCNNNTYKDHNTNIKELSRYD